MHWYLMIVVNPGKILEFKVPAVDPTTTRRTRLTRSQTASAHTPEMDELAEPDETISTKPKAGSEYFPKADETDLTRLSVEKSTEALGQMNLDNEEIAEAETKVIAKKDTPNE